MSDILQTIAAYAEQRVAADKEKLNEREAEARAFACERGDFRFERRLKANAPALICEVKKASPSKGVISADFPYVAIAQSYERAGADCLSVLTEPKWFLGSDEIFREIRSSVALPMLRKDFTVSEYQLYQAKLMGADAALLIVALLGERVKPYIELCDALGLTALVETHDEREIGIAAEAGARVIGVNNRNLRDFTVDFSRSSDLRAYIPSGALFVAESGVSTPADARALFAAGADAALIGEALMRSADRAAFVQEAKFVAPINPF